MEGNRVLGAGAFTGSAVSAILGAGDGRALFEHIYRVTRAKLNALPAAIA
jgi:hypothetical protein